jgi:hypothetical protein
LVGHSDDQSKSAANNPAPSSIDQRQDSMPSGDRHSVCESILRTGIVARQQEEICGIDGNLYKIAQQRYADAGCGGIILNSETQAAAQDVLTAMRTIYAQEGNAGFCRDAKADYQQKSATYAAGRPPVTGAGPR